MRGCGQIHVASRACRGDGLNRIDRPLRIDYGIEAGGKNLLAAANVAEGTVAGVSGCPGGTHRRIADAAEVVVAASEADNDVRPVGRQVIAGMDAVDQQIEVDPLREEQPYPRPRLRLGATPHRYQKGCGT